jgi:putative spermidine/putrescine transport system permease protein
MDVDLRVSDEIARKCLAENTARSQRTGQIRAAALIAPLLIFLLLVYIGPVAKLLSLSFIDNEVGRSLPSTISSLKGWSSGMPVPTSTYVALAKDLAEAKTGADVVGAAARLNYAEPGMRALLLDTRRRIHSTTVSHPDARTALLEISPKWGDPATWAAIKQAGGPLTDFYLLSAVDLKRGVDGSIQRAPRSQSGFLAATQRTFEIAFGVTLLAILFGFPFAYFMATTSRRVAAIMMFMILLPFMTAMMVRILAWVILLGRGGVINHALLSFGITVSPIELLYNRIGVYLALLHIFVPYLVLPLYAVMKTVSESQMRAAASLGAPPLVAFYRVYLPQVAPGVAAGALLVFIQCLGVFVVPAILGGPQEQGLPVLIANYVNKTLNWGLAAALSVILLVSVYVLYWAFVKMTKSISLSIETS